MSAGQLRRRALICLAVVILAVASVAVNVANPQAESDEIVAFHSGKVMDVFGEGVDPGVAIVQWESHGGDNQRWRVWEFSKVNNLSLVFIQSQHSGLVLDVANRSKAPGAGLVQTPWAAQHSQLWLYYPFGNTGYTLLFNVNTNGLLADVAGASQANGAAIILWHWLGGLNQIWSVPAPEPLSLTTTTTGQATTTTGQATTTTAQATTTTEEPATTTTTEAPATTTTLLPPITLPSTTLPDLLGGS